MHTKDAAEFVLPATSKVETKRLPVDAKFNPTKNLSACVEPNTTYILEFANPKQQAVDLIVATTTTWFGIQVKHSTGSGSTKLRDEEVEAALKWYTDQECNVQTRGPLAFFTNRDKDNKLDTNAYNGAVFILKDHCKKLLTASFPLSTVLLPESTRPGPAMVAGADDNGPAAAPN